MSVVAFERPPAHALDSPLPWRADVTRPLLASAVDFELITSRSGFDALEAEWNALFHRAARGTHVFQQFNWLWHWANNFTTDATEFAIVAGRRGGRLILIWPTLIERPAGLRQLAWMGDPVSQYGDVLIDDVPDREACLDQSWAFLRAAARVDVVRLAKVRADADAARLLDRAGFAVAAAEEAPAIAVSRQGSYAAYEKRFSAKSLKNRRRQVRRLEECGPLEITRYGASEAAATATRLAFALKRQWLEAKGLASRAFADTRTDAFFADVATGRVRPAGVTVSVLACAGEAADVCIAVTCKGRMALHVIAYTAKFERLSPGSCHMARTIAEAFADDVEVVDFLAPRHDYKMDWADHTVVVADRVLACSVLGRAYASIYLSFVREGAKSAMSSLPRWLTRLLARSLSSRRA